MPYKSIKLNKKEVYMLDVYVSAIPRGTIIGSVYPELRDEEIRSCQSEKAAMEKYWAWIVLGYALNKSLGKKIKEVNFKKTESGKWICDACEFSLSHGGGAVAVAISDRSVGVDVENAEGFFTRLKDGWFKDKLAKNILSGEEKEYSTPKGMLEIWTGKESVYKCVGEKAAFSKFSLKSFPVATFTIDGYGVAVCGRRVEDLRVYRA